MESLKYLAKVLVPLLMVATLSQPANSAIIEYDLEWTGGTNGFYGEGAFSYDDTAIGADNLATLHELVSFRFSIFDSSDILSFEYNLAEIVGISDFTFETDTGLVLQAPEGRNRLFLFDRRNIIGPYFLGAHGCGDFIAFIPFDFACDLDLWISRGGVLTASQKAQIPEPSTITMIGIGLAGLGFTRRKKA